MVCKAPAPACVHVRAQNIASQGPPFVQPIASETNLPSRVKQQQQREHKHEGRCECECQYEHEQIHEKGGAAWCRSSDDAARACEPQQERRA